MIKFHHVAVATLIVVVAIGGLFFAHKLHNPSEKISTQQEISIPATREYPVESFSKISINVPAHIAIKQADHESLTITAPTDTLNQITVDTKDHKLTIKHTSDSHDLKEITINILTPTIKKITIKSAATLDIPQLITDALKLKIDGAITVNMHLQATQFEVESSGTSTLLLAGTVKEQEIEIKGTSTYQSAKLATQKTSIEVSGTATIEINASEKLNIHIAGTANIGYAGNPPAIEQDIKGTANLYRIAQQ